MCFANRTICKRCRVETIQYVSKCDQYPEVITETPTHGIRGRHRRIRACKDCKRKEKQRLEEESRNNAVHHGQAKAILEWMRLERPLPFTDEVIFDEYTKLFNKRERLHPYCVGFTNIHERFIFESRCLLVDRAEVIARECLRTKRPLSPEAERAVKAVTMEPEMMDEAFRIQAKIDSGVRTMTEADQGYSLHELGKKEQFDYAIELVSESQGPLGPKFRDLAPDLPEQFITEDSVREEINEYVNDLAREGFDEMIHEFREQVILQNTFDEQAFDFSPNTPASRCDAPGMPPRVTFREWVIQYDRAMGTASPDSQRWHYIVDGYRDYLAQISPAQHRRFIERRNSVALCTRRVLTFRYDRTPPVSDAMIQARREPIGNFYQGEWWDTYAETDDDLGSEDWVHVESDAEAEAEAEAEEADDESQPEDLDEEDHHETSDRDTLERSLAVFRRLVLLYNLLLRDLPDPTHPAAPFITRPMRFIHDQLESNTLPTEAEWTAINQSLEIAFTVLREMNDQVDRNRALVEEWEQVQLLERAQEQEPNADVVMELELEAENDVFFFDSIPMPMHVEVDERYHDDIAYARRSIVGISPRTRALEWEEEQAEADEEEEDFYDDGLP